MDTAQILIVGGLGLVVTHLAAFFVGYWYGEKATAEAIKEMRNFYNGGNGIRVAK